MTDYTLSRYVVFSNNTYLSPSDQQVRLAYGTRTSQVIPLTATAVSDITSGHFSLLEPRTLDVLRRAEIVLEDDGAAGTDAELSSIVSRNAASIRDDGTLHIGLLPTSYCNMGCSYCGQSHERGRLGTEHRDAVRRRVVGLINRPETRRIRLDWFGAEPLVGLPVIVDLSRAFLQAARDADVEYSSIVVTNGTLLTPERARQLVAAGVTHLEITLDGPPEVHDVHRPLKSGRQSFTRITTAIQQCLADATLQSLHFRIRSNIDDRNVLDIPRFHQIMAQLGFAHPRVEFSMFQVHSWGNDISEHHLDAPSYAALEAEWLRDMQRLGLRVALLPTVATHIVCPAVTPMAELISSTGKVFSCSEQPLVPRSEEEDSLGTVADLAVPRRSVDVGAGHGGPALIPLRPRGKFDDWNSEVAEQRHPCSRCVLFPTCGGSCPKAWQEGNPPCPSYKFNIQPRLDLIAERSGFRPMHAVVPVGP